jgi:DNA repair ATPase RecN
MARRRAIEADELFETANRLLAEGKEVTAVGLLDALGGGSLRTIYKHLEVWQQSRPAEVKNEVNEIPLQVQASFASAWRMAAQEAGREVQAVKEKAAEEVNAALRQFHGALDALGKLEADYEADTQELETLKIKLIHSEKQIQELANKSVVHQALAEQLQKTVDKQDAELTQLRTEANKAAELRGTIATLQEQNDKFLEQLTKPDKKPK